MKNTRRLRVIMMTVCLLAPGMVLAQGADHKMGMPGAMGPDSGSMKQMQGMMEHLGGMMEHLAARIQAGPTTAEETKQMSEVMGHMTDMMQKLAGMMGSETMSAGGQCCGTVGTDMQKQMATMMERVTDMHKLMMGTMTPSAPAPQPDKK
ncbi:MAG: hypothetical protein AB7N91_10595 [Candidatus Tectimicrobiota bacterium]